MIQNRPHLFKDMDGIAACGPRGSWHRKYLKNLSSAAGMGLYHSADGPYSGYSATNSSQLCNGQSSVCPATLRSTSMQVTS